MKRIAVLVLFVSAAGATQTRLITMGGFGDYLVDDGNTDTYPTQAYFFPNTVVGELGSGDPVKGLFKAMLELGDEGRLGQIYLASNRSPTDALAWRVPSRYYPDPGLEAGYLKNIGHLLLAGHMGYMGRYRSEPDSGLLIRSDLAYGRFGVGWLTEGFPTELSLAYYTLSGRDNTQGALMEGARALVGCARSLWPVSDQTVLVFAARYYTDDLSDNISTNNTYTETSASVGFNTTPLKGYTLIAGLNYWGYKETGDEFNGASVTTGLEATITRFLLFRVGASKYFWGVSKSGDSRNSVSSFYYNFGLGIKVEELLIDGYINKDLLYNGPYFIGGEPAGLFGSVSVKYHFRQF